MNQLKHTRLSILDLAPISAGSTHRQALQNAVELAQLAESLNYSRYWVAEHHNIMDAACAATSIVIAHIAANTEKIRVGSGGIMLPNHAPYVVAEQFGTLDALHPGRIDLGLGRAPGTNSDTSLALKRDTLQGNEEFSELLAELQHYLAPACPGQSVIAMPGAGADLQLWILGSSLYGARLAAYKGLPFVFAAHFAPTQMQDALSLYRREFRPSEQHPSPYVITCVNASIADSQDEAEALATTEYQKFLGLIRGERFLLPPPVQSMDGLWNLGEEAYVREMLKESIHGDPKHAQNRLQNLLDRTGADEIMVNSWIYDQQARLHSYSLLAEIMGNA
jgi:luciferase family oxidoreductase group 1